MAIGVLVVTSQPSKAYAAVLSGEQKKVFMNGIGAFDVTENCNTSSSGSNLANNATVDERLQYIYTWFRGRGLTSTQAAAAVGNITSESKGNWLVSQYHQKNVTDPMTIPSSEQAKAAAEKNGAVGVGRAWGLIQWDHGARALYYQKKAGISGDISDINTQLQIILWHMKNESPTSAQNMLENFNQTDIGEATKYYDVKMEGPRHDQNTRIAAAKNALEKYESSSNMAYTSSSDTGDVSALAASGLEQTGCSPTTPSSVDSSDKGLIALIQKYAWPTPNHKPTGEQTDGYQMAILAAKVAHRYIGGSNGNDCGGFITRLMQDSGRDPKYGGGGNTSAQMAYLKKHTELYKQVKFSEAKFGDIGIFEGHTFMYIGDAVPGFKAPIVEAAYRGGDASSAPRNIDSVKYNNSRGAIYFRYIGGGSDAV